MTGLGLLVSAGTASLSFAGAYGLLDDEVLGYARLRLSSVFEGLKGAALPLMRIVQRPSGGLRVQVRREMPGFLDIVTLGLSAGLSFDASLELYCERSQTELSRRIADSMLLWRMGVATRAEALDMLATDLDDPSFERFAATVSEALAFGTPLASTLERQSELLRAEQRSQVEEEIERVPVKMLIPLGTLIVPAMLLAILGPLLGPALSLG